MPKTELEASNPAELYYGKNLHVTSKIYDWARFASTTLEVNMGMFCFIGDFCFISVPRLLMMHGSQVNSGARITGRKPVVIGFNSVVGYGCTLTTSSDSTDGEYMNDASEESKRSIREGPIEIGSKVFIGAHSIIMPDVKIADGSVVRAFSYVNKSLKWPDTVYGGQPAEPLRKRKTN